MSSLEEERLKNIQANRELLKSLELQSGGKARLPSPAPKAVKAPRKPRAAPKKPRVAPEELGPPRRSSRYTTILTSDPEEAEKAAKRQREEEEELAELRRQAKRARHDDRSVSVIYPTGANWKTEEQENTNQQSFTTLMGALAKLPIPEKVKLEVAGELATPTKKGRGGKKTSKANKTVNGEADYEELKSIMSGLSLTQTHRVVPERIYSMAVHPDPTQEIVFVGDKSGHLGVLNAAHQDVAKEEDDEEESLATFTYRAHTKSSISCIRLSTRDPHTLYTSGYDCTLRSLNFETGNTTEIVDADVLAAEEYGEDEALLSGFDLTADGNCLWISDNRGGVLHRDLRQKKSSTRRWQLSENKIGCISVNPADDTIFVTAHLNRDMRIYDARMLEDEKTSLNRDVLYRKCCLSEFTHDKACSSAYFDWEGKRILSTSYDNTFRVYNTDPSQLRSLPEPFEANVVIPHDNQTGRYVSVFKAQWSKNQSAPAHFTCGNMKRGLDVYSANGENLVTLYDGDVSAIPSVTATHPSIVGRAYGGNGSGKVYVWQPSDTNE